MTPADQLEGVKSAYLYNRLSLCLPSAPGPRSDGEGDLPRCLTTHCPQDECRPAMKSFPTLPFIFGAVLLTACALADPSTQTPQPPSEATQACAPLDETTPSSLRELFTAGTPGEYGEIIALKVPTSSDDILSLHIGNPRSSTVEGLGPPPHHAGRSRSCRTKWVLDSRSPGDLVMGSTRSDNRAGGKEPREHVGGVLLWNTNTGALASCVEAPCPNRPPSDLSALPTLVGASLAPDASLVLIYNELGVIRVNLPDLKYEQVYDNMSPGIPSSDVTTIGLVTFDATGMRYAVGLEEGAVAVVPIQQPWWAFLRNPLVLGKNDQSDLKTIADIAFSPDGSWLARGAPKHASSVEPVGALKHQEFSGSPAPCIPPGI